MRSRSVFQLFAAGRVGEHEVELAGGEAILQQCRAEAEVVSLLAFAPKQQVSLGDGVRLRVDLLAEEVDGDLFPELLGQVA